MSKRKVSSDQIPKTIAKKIKPNGHWADGLKASMEDPDLVIQTDDQVVVISDKYPKAEYHYLVLPKENIISLKKVNKSHLELLKHMHKVGEKLANKKIHNGKKFNLGYHAEASMSRLHLHVISEDFNSICLKTKRHWNSFTSDFFMNSEAVIKSLENEQEIKFLTADKCKQLIDSPLKCQKCDYVPKNMPNLKKHLKVHFS